jgi:hypothetical protein
MSKKVISFSLWGTEPKYLIGAEKNISLQREYYPGWVCRFYVDKAVPSDIIKALSDQGAEIVIKKDYSDGYEGLFWRFEPGFDETVERFIVRDCDSRLNGREADAVNEWIQSGLPFHCMRDHQGHDIAVLGAMWGAKFFFVHDFKNLYTWFVAEVAKAPIIKRAKYFYTDQIFLNQIIWPKVHDKAFVHDDLKRFTGAEKSFRVALPEGQFVGQQWGADDKPLIIPI